MDDYKVNHLSYRALADQADHLKKLAGITPEQNTFDVVQLLHHVVLPALRKLGKVFTVSVFEGEKSIDEPAYVDLKNRVLHVASWVLRDARAGDPFSRLVIAHEIGHMILHKDQEMAFSDSNAVQLNFLSDEESAEWQAHNFALLLLLSDPVIYSTRNLDLQSAEILTGVQRQWISDRRFLYERENKVSLKSYTGIRCTTCQCFSMLRNGTLIVCEVCGNTASE